jgi:hypothetical protein
LFVAVRDRLDFSIKSNRYSLSWFGLVRSNSAAVTNFVGIFMDIRSGFQNEIPTMALTDVAVRSAKPSNKPWKLADGRGDGNVSFAPKADIHLDTISKFQNLKILWGGSAGHLRRIERLPALRQAYGHHLAPKPSAPRLGE